MRKQTLALLTLPVTAVLAAGYGLVQTPQAPEHAPPQATEPVVEPASPHVPTSSGVLELPEPDPRPEELPPLPSHLADAYPELVLTVDAEGRLKPTPDVRRLFDFYLSGLTDEPLDLVLRRIEQTLTVQLAGNPQALTEARDLLRRYVDYRLELDNLDSPATASLTTDGFDLTALQDRQQRLQALRSATFSSTESEAFFALDAVQDEYMLDYLEVVQNPALGRAERSQALASLEHSLPTEVRQVRQRITRNAELYEQARQMRQQGASSAEIYQARAQVLGDEAAANLAALDQQRAHWQQRLQSFAAEQHRIRQSGLSPEAQQSAIEQVIQEQFSGTEALRVRALAPEL